MKFAVSILAHEKPAIVLDQIANFRRFLPDAAIVLHLHVKFDWGGRPQDFTNIEGVFVNPDSLPTAWGNLHHAHNANFHFAKKLLDFDYFLLHSSSDLFVRKGAEGYIPRHEAGVSFLPPQPIWGAPLFAEGDPVFQRIMKDAGADELWWSQVEGTFYSRKAFNEIVGIIERHFDYRRTLPYVHEEIYYPTIAKGLGIRAGYPILLREDKASLPPLDSRLVEAIRSGKLEDHRISRWKLGRQVEAKVWEGAHIYAMRPIPRNLDNPTRAYIRLLEN